MVITCAECETAQFLQITRSRMYFRDGEDLEKIREEYECTLCSNEGTYHYDDGEETITGGVESTRDYPKH